MEKTFKSIQQLANIIDSVATPLYPGYNITKEVAKEVAKVIEDKQFEVIGAEKVEKLIEKLTKEKQFEEAKNICYSLIKNSSAKKKYGYFWLGRIFSAESWDIKKRN